MNYWLMKSEPNEYSWQDLQKSGKYFWNEIRNYRARNNIKAMKVGDLAFFYHSNIGKDIVGVMEIVGVARPDATATDGKDWVGIDVSPKYQLKRAVSLQEIKENHKLQDMQLVKISRLSVSEVSKLEWDTIIKMSES